MLADLAAINGTFKQVQVPALLQHSQLSWQSTFGGALKIERDVRKGRRNGLFAQTDLKISYKAPLHRQISNTPVHHPDGHSISL